MRFSGWLLAASLATLAASGCAHSQATFVPEMAASAARSHSIASRIKHIVIVVQENRSFDNVFAGYPGAQSTLTGYAHDGTPVRLKPIDFNGPDITHPYGMALANYDGGNMDGFDLNYYASTKAPAGTYPYAYLERPLVAPYWSMAKQYTLADHMFATEWGSSFTAHLDLIAATTRLTPTTAEVDFPSSLPWGCDAPAGTTTRYLDTSGVEHQSGPAPCFTQFQTLADKLDKSRVSWRYYTPPLYCPDGTLCGGLWSAFDAVAHVRYGNDWSNVVSPQTTILNDVKNGTLPQLSWVVPDNGDSDHPGSNSSTGPSWVSAIVNAVGQSPYWSSTAIIVLWDDWGGFYDNVPPPQLDYLGLGFRVPCIIISPYSRHGYVSHTQYEFGSVLKFAEQTFHLTTMGYTDVRANTLLDSFNFAQSPRAFVPISAPYPASYFLSKKPSGKAPDDE